MTKQFNPHRLTAIREARGLTMHQLAGHLGLTPTAIHSWESGKTAPRFEMLIQMAETLAVPVDFFSLPVSQVFERTSPVFFRSRADTLVMQKKMAYRRIEWLSELVGILSEFVTIPEVRITDVTSGDRWDYCDAEIESIALKTRQAMGVQGFGPIENVVKLAENSGIIVSQFSIATAMDGFSVWVRNGPSERPFALIDTLKDSPGRLRFSLAHEIGHIVLHKHIADNPEDRKMQKELERQANLFSSSFLMPKDLFSERVLLYGTQFDDLIRLKTEWRVSMQAILHRMKDLELIDASHAQALYKKMSRLGFRKKEPGDEFIPLEEPTLFQRGFAVMQSEKHDPNREFLTRMQLPPTDLNDLIGSKFFSPSQETLLDGKVIPLSAFRSFKNGLQPK